MENPVLVDVMRGQLVESRHRGAVAVVDADGNPVLTIGDVGKPVFPRSAIKALQALAMVESGAADQFKFEPHELALACASHSAETKHVETVKAMLAKIGLDETALECGCHRPIDEAASLELAEQHQTPLLVHNNCSGKHTGFLCLARHMDVDHHGYVKLDHPVQRKISAVLEEMTGEKHQADCCATDGCSVPTYAIPLRAIALGFARFATGQGLSSQRAEAAKRLYAACVENPWYVAGSNRACTRMMEAGKGRVFAKTGAEGVYCAAIPELGFGIAIKCDDGSTRAAEAIMATVIADLLPDDDAEGQAIHQIGCQTLVNRNGIEVGEVRASGVIGP